MEGDVLGDVEVQLTIELVVVLFIDQVIEVRELIAAKRRVAGGRRGGLQATS